MAPQGAANIRKLIALVGSHDKSIPGVARECLERLSSMLNQLDGQIKELDAEIARRARSNEMARRLMTVPGIGPLIATALVALAPPPETFRRGRDFAAWLGLVPRQHSTGGKQRLGATTKMGERSIRRSSQGFVRVLFRARHMTTLLAPIINKDLLQTFCH